jgi:glycosyltransferase involved in cell wall biosynthesis
MISVIVPTYNGATKIPNLLLSLATQTNLHFEVVVVVDGSTDNTVAVIESLKGQLPFSIQVIIQANSGRGGVRNVGVAHATYPLVLFLDDDIRLTHTIIEQHLKHHNTYPKSILTGSTLEDPNKCITDFHRYRRYLTDKWMAPFQDEHPCLTNNKQLFLSAAHCSLLKTDFHQIGGFNASLTDGEDAEFAKRAAQLNLPIYVDMNCIAFHDDYPTCGTFIQRQKAYAQAAATFRKKSIVFYVGQFQCWIYLIDHTPIFRIFPKKWRYRMYDVVVQAHIQSSITR